MNSKVQRWFVFVVSMQVSVFVVMWRRFLQAEENDRHYCPKQHWTAWFSRIPDWPHAGDPCTGPSDCWNGWLQRVDHNSTLARSLANLNIRLAENCLTTTVLQLKAENKYACESLFEGLSELDHAGFLARGYPRNDFGPWFRNCSLQPHVSDYINNKTLEAGCVL